MAESDSPRLIAGRKDSSRRLNLALIVLSAVPLLLFAFVHPRHALSEIHHAALQGDVARIEAILQRHPEAVHYEDVGGSYPLHFACIAHQLHAARSLLGHGARVDAVNMQGQSALYVAISNNDGAMAEMLLKSGADANRVDRYGVTPLHVAVSRGQLAMVELLAEHGARVETRHQLTGHTALHEAVLRCHVPMARVLLRLGANPGLTNKRGESSLQIAQRLQHREMILLLTPGPVGAGTEPSRRN